MRADAAEAEEEKKLTSLSRENYKKVRDLERQAAADKAIIEELAQQVKRFKVEQSKPPLMPMIDVPKAPPK